MLFGQRWLEGGGGTGTNEAMKVTARAGAWVVPISRHDENPGYATAEKACPAAPYSSGTGQPGRARVVLFPRAKREARDEEAPAMRPPRFRTAAVIGSPCSSSVRRSWGTRRKVEDRPDRQREAAGHEPATPSPYHVRSGPGVEDVLARREAAVEDRRAPSRT